MIHTDPTATVQVPRFPGDDALTGWTYISEAPCSECVPCATTTAWSSFWSAARSCGTSSPSAAQGSGRTVPADHGAAGWLVDIAE